tara:strand:- start:1114 stop:1527 length:414 start_codon:yes stop_codon:yes gene_type:complete
MTRFRLLEFREISDARGALVALEECKNIPIEVRRIYYIYDTPVDRERGFHAHKELRQVAVCLKGSVDILMDDGAIQEKITLNHPSKGLVIDNMQWHVMSNFSSDCVLLVLADDEYKESDYIRNYEEFLKLIGISRDS